MGQPIGPGDSVFCRAIRHSLRADPTRPSSIPDVRPPGERSSPGEGRRPPILSPEPGVATMARSLSRPVTAARSSPESHSRPTTSASWPANSAGALSAPFGIIGDAVVGASSVSFTPAMEESGALSETEMPMIIEEGDEP